MSSEANTTGSPSEPPPPVLVVLGISYLTFSLELHDTASSLVGPWLDGERSIEPVEITLKIGHEPSVFLM